MTIASGQTSATFTVTATDDGDDDDGESVTLGFGTLPSGVSAGTQATATVSLTDNDHPRVTAQFGAASYTATEGGAAATVTVTLSADPERSVTIPITAAGAGGAVSGDYSLSATSVTITSGQTSASFTVTATNENDIDDGESVTLGFGVFPDRVSAGAQASATVELVNDDVVAVKVTFVEERYVAVEGTHGAVVIVELDKDPKRTVEIPITVTPRNGAGSADFTLPATSVTINSGELHAGFTVTATEDGVTETGEYVHLTFGTLPAGVTVGLGTLTDEVILRDIVQDVPSDWAGIPSGLEVGDEFRLLFVDTNAWLASSPYSSTYNDYLNEDLASTLISNSGYINHVGFLGSTAGVNARDHTGTTHTSAEPGVPIYWLGGPKVADDYADFYDGSWDHSNPGRDHNGDELNFTTGTFIWTGSNSDGTLATDGAGGSQGMGSPQVQVGQPGRGGNEIHSNSTNVSSARHFYYGLSYVFRVASSSNADLSALTINGTSVTGFAAATTAYTMDVENTTAQVTVAATASHTIANADIAPADADAGVDGHQVDLSVGDTTVTVTAEDGTTKAYTVTITRADPPSSDADLSALAIDGTSVTDFAADTTSYTLDVPYATAQVTVAATASDTKAKAVITPADANTGTTDHDVDLSVLGGSGNTVTVTVTAEDGTIKAYTVTITRAEGSSDADLSALTIDGSSVSDFAADKVSYTMSLLNSTGQVTVEATKSDTKANVVITPADADAAAGHQVNLSGRESVITVIVTAEDGATKAYKVAINRAVVPHDWSLRPPGIVTGTTFRVLIVTTSTRDAWAAGIGAYDGTVRWALTNKGHTDIRDYSPLFKALAGTKDGASPKGHTGTDPDSDGTGEPIWWLNGPKAADDYADFYDGTWDHSNPARTEAGATKTFVFDDVSVNSNTGVWTGTTDRGDRSSGSPLGGDGTNSSGQRVAYFGEPVYKSAAWNGGFRVHLAQNLGLYGLSEVLLVEAPDSPYATVAAITTDPANSSDYRAGDTITATVTFSEMVTVTGAPQLPLRIGDNVRDADYVAGDSSGTVLSFSYTVTADDSDQDGVSIDAFVLKLNGGSVKRKDADVDAALTHTRVVAEVDQSVNRGPYIVDDGVSVTSSPQAGTDTYGVGEDIEITVTFSEAVTVNGAVDFGLAFGGDARKASLVSGNGTTELVFAYTVQAGDSDDNGIWIGDPSHATNPTFSLQAGQSIVGAVSGLDAVLDHDRLETRSGHKVDGTLTGADATLSSLSLSGITLDQTFAATTESYTASTAIASTTVTATPSQSSAGVDITPTDADANTTDHQVTLAAGENTITVTVTATNGSSTRTYTITVTGGLSADADLSALTIDGTSVSGFAAATTTYTVEIAHSVTQVTVAATKSDTNASVAYSPADADTNNNGHQVDLSVGDNPVTVTVSAADGTTTKVYTVTIKRAAVSTNADLSDLTIDGTSVTGFAAATTSYSVNVAGTVVQVTIAGAASDGNATVTYSPADADATTGRQVNLSGGQNDVTVTVTAEDGTTTKTYSVTVNRASVSHDWSLRPPGIVTGDTFRVLIVTSTTRRATSGDIADYDGHVRWAVTNQGHADVRDYSPQFKALAGTKDGASPKGHTGTDPDSDGTGEEIWWLNGPRAANDYDDFYDGSWDHSNPARTEAGATKTFAFDNSSVTSNTGVWTGTTDRGDRSSGRHLGTTQRDGAGNLVARFAEPFARSTVWSSGFSVDLQASLGLYGLSEVLLVEAPDTPYATVAAITSDPANSSDYRTGETIKATVTFSEDVTVTGTPRLPLHIGDNVRDADYVAGDSSDTVLSFSYTVTADDSDQDGVSINAFVLKLNGGSVKRKDADVDAALTHTEVAAEVDQSVNRKPYIVDDGVAVTSSPRAANDTYGVGEDIEITVTFDQAVTASDDVDFGLSVSGPRRAPLVSGSGTTKLVFAYTVQAGDDDDNGIWIGDHASGNPTFALQAGQSIVGAELGLDAVLEHDEVGQQSGHKVDGSLTGADATLSALSLSGITLDQTFATGTESYTASTAIASTTVTATPSQSSAGVDITPTDADANTTGHEVTLAAGENTITATVTATNGSSMRTYTIIVTRAAIVISNNANLSALTVGGTSVTGFAAGTTAYTHDVENSVAQVTVAATESDSNASVAYSPADADTVTTGHQLDLVVGPNTVTVTVTAEDGTTTKTYTVTVNRAGSSDADLSALTVDGTSVSGFAAATTAYTHNVENSVTQVTVAATATDSNASVAYSPADADTVTTGHQVDLLVGNNAVTVTVTAADGTTKDYTVTVNRAKGETDAPTAMTATVNPSGAALSSTDANTVLLTMGTAIAAGETVSVAYTAPSTGGLQDSNNNTVETFSGRAAPNRPAAPALTLVPGAAQITASWDAPADGGSTITAYDVQYQAAADAGYTTVSRADAAATSEIIASLVDGTAYTVQVRAVNAAGSSPWAEASTTAGVAYPAPDGPFVFWGDAKVLVRWIPAADAADDDSELEGWHVQWKTASQEWSSSRQMSVDKEHSDGYLNFETLITGLSNGTEVEFRVRARVSGRTGLWTAGATTTPAKTADTISAIDAEDFRFIDGDTLDAAPGRINIRYYDEGIYSITDEGLAEFALRRTFYFAEHSEVEAGPLTSLGFEFKFKIRAGHPFARTVFIRTLHEGATHADWGSLDYPLSYVEWPSELVGEYEEARLARLYSADGQAHLGSQGFSTHKVEAFLPSDTPVLGAPVAGDGSLELSWQDLLWVAPDGDGHPYIYVQWRSGSEEFVIGPHGYEDPVGDRTIRLTGQALKDALISASYTLTGLEAGTTYFVRLGKCNADVCGILSNVVSGTPVDATAPSPVLVLVSEDGMTVDIVFDEDLDSTRSAPAASAFMVTVGTAAAVAPASVAFHSTDANTITLTMSTALAARATVSVDYTKPSSNALADAAGNEVDSFPGQAAVYPPTAPGTPTLTPGDMVLDVSWTAPSDDGGSALTGYTVQWRTNSQTWDEAVAANQTASATASPYQITGLTNSTEYVVRVIAANAAGSGPASPEQTATPRPPPTIATVEVTSTPQAATDTYGVGEDIVVTVTFSEAVTVTGAVDFGLSISGARRVPLVSGSGTTQLVFAHTVQATDLDTNGIFIGNHVSGNPTFALQAGQSIVGAVSGLDAVLEHARVDVLRDHNVNGTLTGGDARLSALSLSRITLDQTFARNLTEYTASADVAATTVTASPVQSGAGAAIDPADADAGTAGHQVTLDAGENTITVTVTSSNGNGTRTSTITVDRAATVDSNDATLSALTVDGTSVTNFAAATTAYTHNVENSVARVTVAASATDSNAIVEYLPADADSGTSGHQVDLVEGDNTVTVTVTAEDGTTKTYTLTIKRAEPAASSDADLSALTIDGTSVTNFAAGTIDYTHNVENSVAQVTVAATKSHSSAGVEYSPADADTGTAGHQVDLTAGVTTVTVTVTAEDGTTTTTYTVTVNRAGSSDADLSALTVRGTSVSGFAAGTTTYTHNVENSVARVTVAAAASDSNAGVEYSPADAGAAAGHQVDLVVGDNTVTFTVTAEDGTTTQV